MAIKKKFTIYYFDSKTHKLRKKKFKYLADRDRWLKEHEIQQYYTADLCHIKL